MNNDEKSIAYAFIANGVQIFLDENKDSFTALKLVCEDCGESWYMNLRECFLCGAINSFLFRCSECSTFQSITKSNGSCSKCGSDNLYMACPNEACLSNTDEKIREQANGFGGVFNNESGLLIAQQYCLKCGSNLHRYATYEIYVRKVNKNTLTLKELNLDIHKLEQDSRIIIKYVKDNLIKYALLSKKDLKDKISLNNLKDSFGEIVNELYPIKTK